MSTSGLLIKYTWQEDIEPGEKFAVEITTNYTFPVIILLVLVIIIILVHRTTLTPVTASKQVSHVKTKSDKFALKVKIRIKAHSNVKNLSIADRIPNGTKIYEKFGIKPDKVDTVNRKIAWNLGSMKAGEERTFSYIIYSDLKVFGRFELPAAAVVFEHNGKREVVRSNQAIFMSEAIRE